MSRPILALGLIVALGACQKSEAPSRPSSVADSVASTRFEEGATLTIFSPVGPPPSEGAPPMFGRAQVDVSGSYVLGQADAPITLIEFADFECPFCARAHARFAHLRDQLVSEGTLRWVFLDFPLPIHQRAFPAAAFARCAAESGTPADFWRAHDALFERQTLWSNALTVHDALSQIAREIGVPVETADCAVRGGHDAFLSQSFERGRELGIPGTPSVFVNGLPFGSTLEPQVLERVINDLRSKSAEVIMHEQGLTIVEEGAPATSAR